MPMVQEAWPPLPLAAWKPTLETLHRWTQIVGKTRLALAPPQNHWWHVTLYLTTRGLSTSPIPHGTRTFEIEFDFIGHELVVRTSDDDARSLPLVAQSVADFYRGYMDLLRALDVSVSIRAVPNELLDATPFAEDRTHASYDADAAHRCWRVLAQADRVIKIFRGRFIGKCSPVHFWWGSFDLACTRFSGRRAPRHPGGIPNCPDYVTLEAYSHECISAGWWPGGGMGDNAVAQPAFYAYAYPEPPGCADAPLRPDAAFYHPELHEWVLPYDAVRSAANPDAALLDFLQSTYDAAATRGGWNPDDSRSPSPESRQL